MIPLRQALENIADRVIAEREGYHQYSLVTEDREFLRATITSLIFDMADKFILGGKEHNPDRETSFVNDCNHLMELDKEVVDFVMYSRAFRLRHENPQYRKENI